MSTETATFQIGDRYVWAIPDVNFGPIFMTVKRVLAGGVKPRVTFECFDPQRTLIYKRTAVLPLTRHMVRRDWTMDEALNSRKATS